jgi:radical SAM superfamily enzyme YgiQ (UPF0313 family)
MSATQQQFSILICKPRLAVQTIRLNRFIRCEPLELEYLYTVLQHHDPYLLDGIVDRRDPVRLAARLKSEIVLFTSLITTVSDVLAYAERLKKLSDPPRIFVGGPHAEVVPEDFFSEHLDGVFFANQLEGIAAVVDRITRDESFDDIPGAAFRVKGSFRSNPSPPLNPAKLPKVKHYLLEKYPDRYSIVHYKPCASIKTSFGCTGTCTFCFCTIMNGGLYKERPIRDVVDEIVEIPVKHIFILDDNFLHNRRRLLEFCDLIRQRNIQKEFVAIGNAEFVVRNKDVMSGLRAAGLRAIMVGFEFVTDRELKAINKIATHKDNERAIDICRELDIDLFALFIIDPDWEHADFRRLAKYLRTRYIPFALFSTLTIFPGTELAKRNPDLINKQVPGWRYDLLRLHQRPQHMSRFRFYLWLFYLYMIPGKKFTTQRKFRKQYGIPGLVKHSLQSLYTGLEYLVKLSIWR